MDSRANDCTDVTKLTFQDAELGGYIFGSGRLAYDCTDLIHLFMNDPELVGYLIGDGYVSCGVRNNRVGFCTGSPEETSWPENKVKSLNVPYCKGKCGRFGHKLIISRKALAQRLLSEGCGGPSHEKRIPSFIMNGTSEAKRLFLRGLYQADGCVTGLKGNGRCQIRFASVSMGLVGDVIKLLQEEGVNVGFQKCKPMGLGVRDSYHIYVKGLASRFRFFGKIGFSFGEKRRRVVSWAGYYKGLIDSGSMLRFSKSVLEADYRYLVS